MQLIYTLNNLNVGIHRQCQQQVLQVLLLCLLVGHQQVLRLHHQDSLADNRVASLLNNHRVSQVLDLVVGLRVSLLDNHRVSPVLNLVFSLRNRVASLLDSHRVSPVLNLV